MYHIKTDQFEGPLELLLDLIEREKLSINQISLARIADEYIAYLKSIEQFHPHEVAGFLVIASTLMLIKSRTLLPQLEISKEEETDMQDLEHRLKLYRRFRELARHIADRERARQPMYERETAFELPLVFYPPQGFGIADMAAVVRGIILALPKKEVIPEKTVRTIVSLEERMEELRKKTEANLAKSFQSFVGSTEEKLDIIISFLAMLELIKQGVLFVEQQNIFHDITIEHTSTPHV
ncbi:MAG: hypothetical protein A3C84_02215 [Candidatus Ryanbacteria bacterium RIFCSPHIGHO2_02_FULL_48_12]|uniref:Segregation and condensation protein A n=1 Tax=Candidatus Ryanbacteria bacterium RIFCSPHIGHO2_01_FULL_48_27 TaxID=1802115 RepID=A0A1G2G357_9BACT|nr:MAG: hypothetical protein A2756_04645 [Candidatus Ryanbacteria bacterium RIFCSPHIGHO2_01_FULL_48_27]OGZ49267.1 MAG: hypothetical protein A3C84_02215 [Candidatus Ryanbacteria bacterium RIFCSPHIGHO2_02_FULL_48_12]